MEIQAFSTKENINPELKATIKLAILKICAMEETRWPSIIHCVIWIDGKPYQIADGSWQLYPSSNTVYLPRMTGYGEPVPIWAAPVLMAIALFFQLSDDVEVMTAIKHLFANTISGAVKLFYSPIAAFANGESISMIACDPDTKAMAVEANGQWVLPNGEPVIPTENWIKVQI